MKRRLTLFLGLSVLFASPVRAQTPLPDRVYVLDDTAGWRLVFHTTDGTCEAATRLQPGARFARFKSGLMMFSVSLQGDPQEMLPAHLDSLFLRLDDSAPIRRRASGDERRNNLVLLKGDASTPVLAAKRLRLRATYRTGGVVVIRRGAPLPVPVDSAAGFQTLDIDLRGLNALYPRVLDSRCR